MAVERARDEKELVLVVVWVLCELRIVCLGNEPNPMLLKGLGFEGGAVIRKLKN